MPRIDEFVGVPEPGYLLVWRDPSDDRLVTAMIGGEECKAKSVKTVEELTKRGAIVQLYGLVKYFQIGDPVANIAPTRVMRLMDDEERVVSAIISSQIKGGGIQHFDRGPPKRSPQQVINDYKEKAKT